MWTSPVCRWRGKFRWGARGRRDGCGDCQCKHNCRDPSHPVKPARSAKHDARASCGAGPHVGSPAVILPLRTSFLPAVLGRVKPSGSAKRGPDSARRLNGDRRHVGSVETPRRWCFPGAGAPASWHTPSPARVSGAPVRVNAAFRARQPSAIKVQRSIKSAGLSETVTPAKDPALLLSRVAVAQTVKPSLSPF